MKGSTGSRIRSLRDKRGWKQVDLAEKAKMNNSVLSRIESGKRPVESEELKRFAEIFNVSTDYLAGFNNTSLSDETNDFVGIIDLSEDEAVKKIKQSFNYKGKDISNEQAKAIYYFSLGVVNKDS